MFFTSKLAFTLNKDSYETFDLRKSNVVVGRRGLSRSQGSRRDLDTTELNNRWADPDMIDSWSQMVIKHTDDSVDICTDVPETGIYKMREDGSVNFDRFDYHRRAVESEDEAFFLQATPWYHMIGGQSVLFPSNDVVPGGCLEKERFVLQ